MGFQAISYWVFYFLPLLTLAVSVIFFVQTRELPLAKRLLASAHRALVPVVLGIGLFVDLRIADLHPKYAWVATAALSTLILASVIYCFVTYNGPKWLHLLHIPTALIYWIGLIIVTLKLMAATGGAIS